MKKIALLSLIALGFNQANAGGLSFTATQDTQTTAAAPQESKTFDPSAALTNLLSSKDLSKDIRINASNIMSQEENATTKLSKELSAIEKVDADYKKLSEFLKEGKEISDLQELKAEYSEAKGKKKTALKNKMRKLFAVKGKANRKEFNKAFGEFLKNTNLVSSVNTLKAKIEKTLKDVKEKGFSSENKIAQAYLQTVQPIYSKLLERLSKIDRSFFESAEAAAENKNIQSLFRGLNFDLLLSEKPTESNLKPEEIKEIKEEIASYEKSAKAVNLTKEQREGATQLKNLQDSEAKKTQEKDLLKAAVCAEYNFLRNEGAHYAFNLNLLGNANTITAAEETALIRLAIPAVGGAVTADMQKMLTNSKEKLVKNIRTLREKESEINAINAQSAILNAGYNAHLPALNQILDLEAKIKEANNKLTNDTDYKEYTKEIAKLTA